MSRTVLLLLAGLVVTAVSAQRAATGVGVAQGEAAAYHGAWQVYRRVALWAGRRALAAEASYWKAVKS